MAIAMRSKFYHKGCFQEIMKLVSHNTKGKERRDYVLHFALAVIVC